MSDSIVLTNQELAELELAAMKRPSRDGSMAPRIVRALIEHITVTYGIDVGFITEEMKHEQDQRKAKEDRLRAKLRRGVGRKSSRSSADDF